MLYLQARGGHSSVKQNSGNSYSSPPTKKVKFIIHDSYAVVVVHSWGVYL